MNNKILMIGEVSAVYPEKAMARVIFPDRDDMTSKELPILFTRALGVEIYSMPSVGEEVLCAFLANGLEEGFILGAYYNKKNKPPRNDLETTIIKFKNGDYIEYKNGVISIQGSVIIKGTVKADKFIGDLQGTADLAKGVGG